MFQLGGATFFKHRVNNFRTMTSSSTNKTDIDSGSCSAGGEEDSCLFISGLLLLLHGSCLLSTILAVAACEEPRCDSYFEGLFVVDASSMEHECRKCGGVVGCFRSR